MKFTFLVPSTDDSSARGYSLLFMSKRKGDHDYPDSNKHRRIDDPGDGQQRRKIPQADPPQPVPHPHGLRSNSKVFDYFLNKNIIFINREVLGPGLGILRESEGHRSTRSCSQRRPLQPSSRYHRKRPSSDQGSETVDQKGLLFFNFIFYFHL